MCKKRMFICIICVVMLVLLCGCESANAKQAKEAFEKGDYAKVVELLSEEEKLDDELQKMLDTSQEKVYDELYSSIQSEINEAEELENNFFAQYVDINDLVAAKKKAQAAKKNSDKESYADVLKDLQSQNESVKEKIDVEADRFYSAPSAGDDSKYAFSVASEDISGDWDFNPLIKQSSKNPEWIITTEAKTTDGNDTAILFFSGNGADYDFIVKNIESKEIKVQTEEKDLAKAVVNTEVTFKAREGFDYMEEVSIVENKHFYLFYDKDGVVNLAVESFDGDDFYILYG